MTRRDVWYSEFTEPRAPREAERPPADTVNVGLRSPLPEPAPQPEPSDE